MKRLTALLSILFTVSFLWAFNQNDIHVFTLENGLTLYLLEDSTTAAVRIELNINAGTVCQNIDNAGCFALYAKLSGLELTPDCVKTQTAVSPSQTEKALSRIAEVFRPLNVTDRQLEEALKQKKSELEAFSNSPAGFINGAIDSRVFADSPWKQESGVSPAVFNKKNVTQLRTILNEIHRNYYIPSNASLYISGNITAGSALNLAEKYFGKASELFSDSNFRTSSTIADSKVGDFTPQKYVLVDDELSSDLTQIVLQYKNFTQNEADLISSVFNAQSSTFKKLLLKQKNLAIRSAEYIDASSAQQSNSSRLVIQAICEKSKVNPATQGELFLQMARESQRLTQEEVKAALKNLNSDFTAQCDSSTLLMKNLAAFNQTNKEPSRTFFNRISSLSSIDISRLNEKYSAAVPYVFVLCNSSIFLKHSADFKKAGYITVTNKNGAWYRQKNYSHLLKNSEPVTTQKGTEDLYYSARRFIEQNKSQFSSFKLKNGIPVTVKYAPEGKTASVSLAIDGGDLIFAEKNAGLSSILVNALAAEIQWTLDELYSTQKLKDNASVTAWNSTRYSLLTINASVEDIPQCLYSAAQTIIFGDITPALADGISYDLRSQWRIKTGTPDFQLLCEAIRTIYSKPFTNLYADTADKPVQMEFRDIAAAYPVILDSSRFSLVITGGVSQSEELQSILNESFGELGTLKATQTIQSKVEKKPLPSKTKKLQLRHQFFTDVSADKAGPRPAILIPTTDFSDPLLFMIETPDISSTDCALFNALLYIFARKLQQKVSPEQTVKVTVPDSDIPYGQIVITKIKHTSQTEKIYGQCVKELIEELENLVTRELSDVIDLEKDELLLEMENLWVLNELNKTADNAGTAFLIQKGKILGNDCLYLDMYDAVSNATATDYYLLAKSYFSEEPALRIYSADSKK